METDDLLLSIAYQVGDTLYPIGDRKAKDLPGPMQTFLDRGYETSASVHRLVDHYKPNGLSSEDHWRRVRKQALKSYRRAFINLRLWANLCHRHRQVMQILWIPIRKQVWRLARLAHQSRLPRIIDAVPNPRYHELATILYFWRPTQGGKFMTFEHVKPWNYMKREVLQFRLPPLRPFIFQVLYDVDEHPFVLASSCFLMTAKDGLALDISVPSYLQRGLSHPPVSTMYMSMDGSIMGRDVHNFESYLKLALTSWRGKSIASNRNQLPLDKFETEFRQRQQTHNDELVLRKEMKTLQGHFLRQQKE